MNPNRNINFNQLRQPQRQPIVNRTIIPERKYDQQIIAQLLLKASTENNFIDLQKFIMENGITTNDMLNDEGQSILHLILLNINLSDRQKLEMIRYFKNNFTLVSSFDKMNQTPLHIAAKLQLYDIVEELINAGHDINAVDSSYKTPLHYIVIGKSIEAPSKEDKPIIPKNKTKVTIKSDLIPNLLKCLVNYFNNSNIKNFIEGQYNTFLNSTNIYGDVITNILQSENILSKMTEISMAINLDEQQKKQKIFDVTYEANKQIVDYLNSLLIQTKKQIKLNPNTENGWGPDNTTSNKILEYSNLADLINELQNNNNQQLHKLNDINNEIDYKRMAFMNLSVEIKNKLNNALSSLYFTFKFLKELNGKHNLNNTHTYDFNGLIIPDAVIQSNFIYNTQNPELPPNYVHGALNISHSVDLSADLRDGLTNEFNVNINDKFKRKYQSLVDDYDNDPQLNGFTDFADHKNVQMGFDLYPITRKFMVSESSLEYSLQRINDFTPLLNEIINPDKALKIITDKIIDILSTTNIFASYMNDYNKMINCFDAIMTIIMSTNTTKVNVPFNGKNHEINVLYDIIIQDLSITIEQMKNEKNKLEIGIFNCIKLYYDLLNDYVKYINENKAIEYIKKYYDNFIDINTIFSTVSFKIDNMFKNPIENLPKFFTSYNDILEIVQPIDDQDIQKNNKTNLLNRFYLQLTVKKDYNFIRKIGDNNPIIDKSRIGFLENNMFGNLDININDLKLKYGANGNENINDADATKIGIHSIINENNDILKSESAFGLVGTTLIDKFYQIQKYLITRFILNDLNKLNCNEIIMKFENEIKSTIKPNNGDRSILFIIIGKLIDKIFNVNIENIIKIAANVIVNNINKPANYRIINTMTLNKIDISNFNVDEISKSIYKLFKKHKSLHYYNYVEKISTIRQPAYNIYKINGANINDNPNNFYMEFDPNILELLIKKGANVNAKDKDGNTPLSIAIIQSNAKAIELLLQQNISVNTQKSKNRLGYSPYGLSMKSILTSIDNFDNDTNMKAINGYIKEINDELLNITKVNHIMRFNNIGVKMLIYLINHLFYSKLNNYSNYRDENLHNLFFSELTSQIDKIPLLENIDCIFVNYHESINTILNDEKNNITNNIALDTRNKNIIDILNNEKALVSTNRVRLNEINNTIKNLKISQNVENINIEDIDKQLNINTEMKNKKLQKVKRLNNRIKITSYPLDIYNDISNELLNMDNDDYKTYTLLWENLFNFNSNDKTQIISKIFTLIKSNPDNLNTVNNCIKALNVINYDIQNYFELPNEYNESNYPLSNIMDIIIHITKHTLMVNFYHMILKLLRNEIMNKKTSIYSDKKYYNKIDDEIKNIINTRFNDKSLKEYIFDTLPEKIVKITLEIYEYEDDEDKNKSIIDLFSFIEKLLLSATSLDKNDSKMLRLLNQNVYPYFKNYFEINIKKLKKITDGYYSMLLNFGDKLYILEKILKKAQTENGM